jgi:hypothetical protein
MILRLTGKSKINEICYLMSTVLAYMVAVFVLREGDENVSCVGREISLRYWWAVV